MTTYSVLKNRYNAKTRGSKYSNSIYETYVLVNDNLINQELDTQLSHLGAPQAQFLSND